jgi:hypothetical protein
MSSNGMLLRWKCSIKALSSTLGSVNSQHFLLLSYRNVNFCFSSHLQVNVWVMTCTFRHISTSSYGYAVTYSIRVLKKVSYLHRQHNGISKHGRERNKEKIKFSLSLIKYQSMKVQPYERVNIQLQAFLMSALDCGLIFPRERTPDIQKRSGVCGNVIFIRDGIHTLCSASCQSLYWLNYPIPLLTWQGINI